MRRRGLRAPILLLLVLGFAVGCARTGAAPAPPPAAPPGELVVFAAASLTEVFNDLAAAFERAQPGSRVVLNYGASSALRLQLEHGARADVFASADEAQMALAREAGLIAGEPQVFARNSLVLIVPRDNPGRVEALRDLARPGVRVVTTGPQVPIGAYTRQMLAALSADPAYGVDFADRVLANVRSEEDNVRAVVAKVVLGEADAAIVYTTDAALAAGDAVRQLPVPPAYDVTATYVIAVLRDALQPRLAAHWVDLVLSDEGQAALARAGFQRAR